MRFQSTVKYVGPKGHVSQMVGHRKRPGGLLKSNGKYGNYSLVNDDGEIVWGLRINRLMLLTWVGDPPSDKHQALHWDDDQSNNDLDNLRWGTSKDNGVDKIRNGKAASGERNAAAKLTSQIVMAMRSEYKTENVTLHEIAKKYNISLAPTWAAIIGRSWKHLPGAVRPRGQGSRDPKRVPRGSKSRLSKLTEDQVKEIKELLPSTKGVALAAMFGISKHTISAIKRNKVWQHI